MTSSRSPNLSMVVGKNVKKKKRKEGTPELEEKKGPHKKKLKTKSTIRKRVQPNDQLSNSFSY